MKREKLVFEYDVTVDKQYLREHSSDKSYCELQKGFYINRTFGCCRYYCSFGFNSLACIE